MRVEFTYNQEEMADTAMRLIARSKTMRSERWKVTVLLTSMSWLAILAIYSYVYPNPYFAVIVAVVAAVANAALYPTFYYQGLRKRIRGLNKERFGDTNAFPCEVELTPEEIRYREPDIQIVYAWKSVEEIVESEDWVDIFTRTGIVVVRNRAFKSLAERDEFVGLARSYLAAASQRVDRGGNDR